MPREHVVRRVGFRVALVLATEPSSATTAAVGVAVGWRRAETLLALVMTGEKDLEENGDDEEDAVNVSGGLFRFDDELTFQ